MLLLLLLFVPVIKDDGAKALASLSTNDTNETEANATWAGRFMLEMRDATEYAGEYALDAQCNMQKLELIWFKYRESADQCNVWRRSNWRRVRTCGARI